MAKIEPHGVDIRRLRFFLAVCDHGGISRAATAIGMAQPALTRQIKLLENEIGLNLLSRTGRGAIPTAPGRYLMEHSRAHLAALDDVVERVRGQYQDGAGELTLGTCPTIAPLFLADLKGFVRARHPSLKLSIIEAYSGDLTNLMECGRIDLALTYRPAETKGLKSYDLLTERLVLVRRKRGSEMVSGLTLKDISRLDLILPSRIHQLRQLIDGLCARRGIRLTPALELDSLEAVKATLDDTATDFVTILPSHSVAADAEIGRFSVQRINDSEMVRTIALVHPESLPGRLQPDFLVEHIRAFANDLKSSLGTVF